MSIGIVVQVMLIASLFEFILSIEPNIENVRVLYANVTGDLVLGGLFPVHRKGINGENCGAIQVNNFFKKRKIFAEVKWLSKFMGKYRKFKLMILRFILI